MQQFFRACAVIFGDKAGTLLATGELQLTIAQMTSSWSNEQTKRDETTTELDPGPTFYFNLI
jgi:hypothetical protein